MPDFVLSANLVNDEFRVTLCFEIFNANLIGDLHPIKRALYSVTLLEHDSVNENARGIT